VFFIWAPLRACLAGRQAFTTSRFKFCSVCWAAVASSGRLLVPQTPKKFFTGLFVQSLAQHLALISGKILRFFLIFSIVCGRFFPLISKTNQRIESFLGNLIAD